jgi:hypothetical protein
MRFRRFPVHIRCDQPHSSLVFYAPVFAARRVAAPPFSSSLPTYSYPSPLFTLFCVSDRRWVTCNASGGVLKFTIGNAYTMIYQFTSGEGRAQVFLRKSFYFWKGTFVWSGGVSLSSKEGRGGVGVVRTGGTRTGLKNSQDMAWLGVAKSIVVHTWRWGRSSR